MGTRLTLCVDMTLMNGRVHTKMLTNARVQ